MRFTEEEYRKLLAKRSAPAVVVERPQRTESKLEIRFAQQLATYGLINYQRNFFFLADRNFELDFAFVGPKIAVEIQGMSHRIKGKFKADIEKRALALLAGWKVLELGGDQVRSEQGIKWLLELLQRSCP